MTFASRVEELQAELGVGPYARVPQQTRRRGRPQIQADRQRAILVLRADGFSIPQIARLLGVGVATVHKYVKAHR